MNKLCKRSPKRDALRYMIEGRMTKPEIAAALIEVGVPVTSGLDKWMLAEDLAEYLLTTGTGLDELTPLLP